MGLEKHDGRYSFFQEFIYFRLSLVFPNLYAVFFYIEHKMVNDQYSLYIFPSKILLFCISKWYMHMWLMVFSNNGGMLVTKLGMQRL